MMMMMTARMHRGLHVLRALGLIPFLLTNLLRQIISGSTRHISTKFSPYGRYLIVDYRFHPLFRWFKGRCHGNQFYGQNWQNRTIHLYSYP